MITVDVQQPDRRLHPRPGVLDGRVAGRCRRDRPGRTHHHPGRCSHHTRRARACGPRRATRTTRPRRKAGEARKAGPRRGRRTRRGRQHRPRPHRHAPERPRWARSTRQARKERHWATRAAPASSGQQRRPTARASAAHEAHRGPRGVRPVPPGPAARPGSPANASTSTKTSRRRPSSSSSACSDPRRNSMASRPRAEVLLLVSDRAAAADHLRRRRHPRQSLVSPFGAPLLAVFGMVGIRQRARSWSTYSSPGLSANRSGSQQCSMRRRLASHSANTRAGDASIEPRGPTSRP